MNTKLDVVEVEEYESMGWAKDLGAAVGCLFLSAFLLLVVYAAAMAVIGDK